MESELVEFDDNMMSFNEEQVIGEIIDGQHRIYGIMKSKISEIELPVVIMFDLIPQEKAYIFSTINSNQVTVPKSLIYDLYDVSELRSPYKTCHEIARALNSDKKSPYYNRLKMLGKKMSDNEVLSQGTFVYELIKMITNNPQKDGIAIKNNKELDYLDERKYPFRDLFIRGKDELIYKIILNAFTAVKNVFHNDWNSEKSILSKSMGYGAILRAMPEIVKRGRYDKKLNLEFFEDLFINGNNLKLTSEFFPPSSQTQTRLAEIIKQSL